MIIIKLASTSVTEFSTCVFGKVGKLCMGNSTVYSGCVLYLFLIAFGKKGATLKGGNFCQGIVGNTFSHFGFWPQNSFLKKQKSQITAS